MLHVTDELVIGVDGGGSSTTAWLAKSRGQDEPLGIGNSGGSNLNQAESFESAFENVESAIDNAFAAASCQRKKVATAVLALAGCGRPEERARIEQLALKRGIAAHVKIVSDASPLLMLASPAGPVIALVSGTGSIGVGRDAQGVIHRSGGWGYLFGDEGSGYSIGVGALRSVARTHDGRGPATKLTKVVCEFYSVESPADLIRVIYDDPLRRQNIARLASGIVESASQGDEVAQMIVESNIDELIWLLKSLVHVTCPSNESFSLVLSGGLFVHEPFWFQQFTNAAKVAYPMINDIVLVQDPTRGAVRMAQAEFDARSPNQ